MKKLIVLGLALLFGGWIHAENISQQKAEKWALQFFQQQSQGRSSSVSLQMVWNGENQYARQQADPAFYVFNRTDQPGYVIIGGDDKAAPILGYSFDTSIDMTNLPENLRNWLMDRKDEINWARAQRGANEVKKDNRWNRLSRESVGKMEKLLHTAAWNQDDPYNLECPTVNGEKAYTGCTATALCIAMQYRQWPDAGVGTVPAYTYKVGNTEYKVESRTLGKAYDWSKMPKEVNASTPEDQKKEIARLMMDVAAMIQSAFDPEVGTGAVAQFSDRPLGKYMKYSKLAVWRNRDDYSLSNWHQMLRAEMENGPIPYTGASKSSAHAFVLDGYTDKNYYHVNWGWSGSSDGFYLLTALAPGSGGIGGGEYDYRLNQAAFFNMKKAVDGEVAPEKPDLKIIGGVNNNVYEFGLRGSTNYFKQGDRFDLQLGSLYHKSDQVLNFLLGVSVFDKDGKWKADISSPSYDINDFDPGLYYPNLKMSCYLNVAPVEGDYMAAAVKMDGTTEWKEVAVAMGTQGRIPLVKTDRPIIGDPFMMIPGTPNEKDFHGIFTDAKEVVPGKEFKVHTGVVKCLDSSYKGELAVVLFDKSNKSREKVNVEKVECDQSALGTILDEQVLTCKIKDAINKGDYLALCYHDNTWGDWKRIKGIDYVTARIALDEKEPEPLPDLEGKTSMTYQVETGTLLISTFADADYELKSAAKVIASGKSDKEGKITILSKDMPQGVVTLTLKYGLAEKVITLEWTKE